MCSIDNSYIGLENQCLNEAILVVFTNYTLRLRFTAALVAAMNNLHTLGH